MGSSTAGRATLRKFFKTFPDEESCLRRLFEIRFGQGHVCPRCSRSARWYRIRSERAYSCEWCGHHIHPTAGTVFDNSRVPLVEWFYVMFRFTGAPHEMSPTQIALELGRPYKTAWRMYHLLRGPMGVAGNDESGGSEFVQPDTEMNPEDGGTRLSLGVDSGESAMD